MPSGSLSSKTAASIYSEAWGPPQFQEKRSRSEKAFRGALAEFQGVLGATLTIQKLILGMRNSILGMASPDLSTTKTTILAAAPGGIFGIDVHPHERFSLAPAISERFFKNWGGPRVDDLFSLETSGRNFLLEVCGEQRSILKLPLSKLRAVPVALQNRALFEGERSF